ncbi:MAG TPA: amidohydrolase [Planctomycetia bacterium]|nr:amidohydrolase [Planctomycetia bacterium]
METDQETADDDDGDNSPSSDIPADPALEAAAAAIDGVFAHLWMVRTFVKHSSEVEDFPELMQVVRAIFDASRAVETRRQDPAAFLRMVRKKLAKLKAAAAEFRKDAPVASDHTNFRMAVRSLDSSLDRLQTLLDAAARSPGERGASAP